MWLLLDTRKDTGGTKRLYRDVFFYMLYRWPLYGFGLMTIFVFYRFSLLQHLSEFDVLFTAFLVSAPLLGVLLGFLIDLLFVIRFDNLLNWGLVALFLLAFLCLHTGSFAPGDYLLCAVQFSMDAHAILDYEGTVLSSYRQDKNDASYVAGWTGYLKGVLVGTRRPAAFLREILRVRLSPGADTRFDGTSIWALYERGLWPIWGWIGGGIWLGLAFYIYGDVAWELTRTYEERKREQDRRSTSSFTWPKDKAARKAWDWMVYRYTLMQRRFRDWLMKK